MWSLINSAADLAAQYPVLAILIAFAAAIIEAVAVLGVLIPGTPILMAVAAAGAMAGMSMMPIMIVAIVGAVIGDFVSYWLGHRFRFRLRGMWPFATRPALMGHAESFFHRYGTASVAICRFVPVLRSTVPLVAGMAGMARRGSCLPMSVRRSSGRRRMWFPRSSPDCRWRICRRATGRMPHCVPVGWRCSRRRGGVCIVTWSRAPVK